MIKRGQERSLLMWVLGSAAVVIVIVFFYNFFNQGSGILDQAPDDATIVAEACKLGLELNNQNAVCLQFRELHFGSRVEYATCDYAVDAKWISVDNWAQKGAEFCPPLVGEVKARAEGLCLSKPSETIVNGKVCYSEIEDVEAWGKSKTNPTGEHTPEQNAQ